MSRWEDAADGSRRMRTLDDKAMKPEIVSVPALRRCHQLNSFMGRQYKWRHPLIRNGAWSRRYDTRDAAVIGMNAATRRYNKQTIHNSFAQPIGPYPPNRIRARRVFGKTVVLMTWLEGQDSYHTIVKSRGREHEFFFSKLPEQFGFAPTSDYAFDITARSALHSVRQR